MTDPVLDNMVRLRTLRGGPAPTEGKLRAFAAPAPADDDGDEDDQAHGYALAALLHAMMQGEAHPEGVHGHLADLHQSEGGHRSFAVEFGKTLQRGPSGAMRWHSLHSKAHEALHGMTSRLAAGGGRVGAQAGALHAAAAHHLGGLLAKAGKLKPKKAHFDAAHDAVKSAGVVGVAGAKHAAMGLAHLTAEGVSGGLVAHTNHEYVTAHKAAQAHQSTADAVYKGAEHLKVPKPLASVAGHAAGFAAAKKEREQGKAEMPYKVAEGAAEAVANKAPALLRAHKAAFKREVKAGTAEVKKDRAIASQGGPKGITKGGLRK